MRALNRCGKPRATVETMYAALLVDKRPQVGKTTIMRTIKVPAGVLPIFFTGGPDYLLTPGPETLSGRAVWRNRGAYLGSPYGKGAPKGSRAHEGANERAVRAAKRRPPVCSPPRDGATQMVDDRALVLPQQETEASKEVHFELPSAVALVPDVVGARVVADNLVRAIPIREGHAGSLVRLRGGGEGR